MLDELPPLDFPAACFRDYCCIFDCLRRDLHCLSIGRFGTNWHCWRPDSGVIPDCNLQQFDPRWKHFCDLGKYAADRHPGISGLCGGVRHRNRCSGDSLVLRSGSITKPDVSNGTGGGSVRRKFQYCLRPRLSLLTHHSPTYCQGTAKILDPKEKPNSELFEAAKGF
ncbi:uncharacterized protein CIMG_10027 [Coccidioides immitis RS]|uniref:Uncharacterized protein n=2 Tax=Coccidioides immitis TaxID=5501 RepID=A0A0E1RUF7_COCIM|nr:uncharacterized protein CIMG_10027 [Coccidioides immitis RS]EAS27422.2 hypothetical protein CIMG_10027 [Coccidioides immitis RS]